MSNVAIQKQDALRLSKPELREWAHERRAMLDMDRYSKMLRQRLQSLPEMQSAQHILIYSAMPQEVDILPMATDHQRNWYLPRCAPKRRLAIHSYVPGQTPLRSGPFGIQEPDPALTPEVEPTILDLVVVPALLLTPDGGRLGYGGGYYDRFLPRLRPDCLKVGLMPSALVVDCLPLDPWDIRLDGVLTEERVPLFGNIRQEG